MDGDLLISKYFTIKIKNPLAFKDARGWFEITNNGINSHYVVRYIEDKSVMKRLKKS